MRLTVAVLASVLAADAEPTRKVGVMPLRVDGELGEQWQRELEDGLLDGLARGEFEVVAPKTVSANDREAASCDDAPCFRRVAKATDAAYLVRSVVVADGKNYTVSTAAIDGATGEVTAQSSEQCEVCGVQEVRDLVADQAAGLRKKLDDLVTGPPSVRVDSTPAKALIVLDGETVGQTPLRREVTAGKHIARAELDGYVAVEREFLAVAGVEETLKFELQALPDRRGRFRPWGWAAVGVGVAALIPGITFLALDERPVKTGGRCMGAGADAQGDCRQRFNTLTPGLALTVTGVVFATVGVAVLVATRKRRSRVRATAAGIEARF